ncbi:MAG: 50S ribosomal protein L30 [Anaerolineales bacterium]|nr:MAG: 50S ribosomal protein L30 [Anaerolineales bacterium]
MAAKSTGKKIKITLVRSPIGATERHKRTVKALGLRKMHQSIVAEDNATVRGMVNSVTHLLKVEEA